MENRREGLDNFYIEVELSNEMNIGDILTYDSAGEYQLVITEKEHPSYKCCHLGTSNIDFLKLDKSAFDFKTPWSRVGRVLEEYTSDFNFDPLIVTTTMKLKNV